MDSSDEDLETFYTQVGEALSEVKSIDYQVILADFNAKIGKGRDGAAVGSSGLGDRNDRGDRLLEFAESEKLSVANTWFKHHNRNLYTWTSPQDGESIVRNQIDYILVRQRYKRSIKNVKTFPGADCDSDHTPVVAKILLKLKKVQKRSQFRPKWKLDYLVGDTANQFNIKTENRFEVLMKESLSDVEESWQRVKDIMVEEARVVIDEVAPQKATIKKKKAWMNDSILDKIHQRRQLKRGSVPYSQMNKLIKKECRKAKLEYIETQCEQIETCKNTHNSRELHSKIK